MSRLVRAQEEAVEAGGKVATTSVLGSDVTDYLRGEEAGLVELRGHLDGCVGVALVTAMMGRIDGALQTLSGVRAAGSLKASLTISLPCAPVRVDPLWVLMPPFVWVCHTGDSQLTGSWFDGGGGLQTLSGVLHWSPPGRVERSQGWG